MAIDTIKSQVMRAVWQGVAQSRVDLSAIPQEEAERMVNTITDRLMVTVNNLMDERMYAKALEQPVAVVSRGLPAVEEEFTEKTLWQGRPFLSLFEKYTITNERIKIIRGLLSRNIENFELIRIQDIDFRQNPVERLIGRGDIILQGNNPSDLQIVLRNIEKPDEVYEILRKVWMEARKRYGLQFREYM